MAFSSSSMSSLSSLNSVTPSLSQGVSASNFINAAGGYMLHRYGPSLMSAAQARMDRTASTLLKSVAGSDSGTVRNGSANTPKSGPPNGSAKGGRRARSNKIPGLGGSTDSVGVPQFTINTGIESGTVINPLQETTDHYSPLYIQCGSLFPDEDFQIDSELSKSLNSMLYYKYIIIVQSEVNFTLAKEFTEINFFNYIKKISYALQLYYMIDSILSYTSHSPNSNLAMTTLRMGINPEISNGHIKLKEMLESTSIPPRLLEYIRYMYQNYSFNNVSGSSIIRLSLNDLLCTQEYGGSLGINSLTYLTIINDLIDCSAISSIIKKIRPTWVRSVLSSSYESLYDPQFSTFWHNSNISYEDFGSNAVKYTINAKDSFDPLYYGIFDNRLDGIIYASCSVTDNNGVIQKGMWKPFSGFKDKKSINSSLLHYSNDRSLRSVTDVSFRNASMIFAAPHVEITEDSNPVWRVNTSNFAGSCIPQVHTLENVTQALTRSVNWLFDPN